jgi:hypothetical protein
MVTCSKICWREGDTVKYLLLCLFGVPMALCAADRFLLAADTQVIEVNRQGRVTDLLEPRGHTGIYAASRLPDGGIAYVHKLGLAVFDKSKRLVMEHAALRGPMGSEANGVEVLNGGSQFALLDSGVNEIRFVDRRGAVVSRTPLPDRSADPLHFRYRVISQARDGNAFWVVQSEQNTLLKVESGTGNILSKIDLAPHLATSAAPHRAFAVREAANGDMFASKSTVPQLLRFNRAGKNLRSWTADQLGLSCGYFLGIEQAEVPNHDATRSSAVMWISVCASRCERP